jgi:cytochrome oxidase assembly protein ShyY1
VPEPQPADAPVVDPWARSGHREPTTMLRAAVRPRMIGMLVLLLLAALACGRLGAWQLDRAHVRGAAAEAHREAQLAGAAPTPLDQVLTPQKPFTGAMVAHRVAVSGTYDASGQLYVGHRDSGGRTGYLVLTPLRTTDGAVLPVVRGWTPTPSAAPAPPSGDVQLVGFLQASEASAGGISGDRAQAISSAELVNHWGGPIYTGYLVLQSSEPAQAPGLVLQPQPHRPGSGLNLQNLLYAAQWWVFGAFAVALWLRMVRDEARGAGPADAAISPGAGPDPGPPADAAA